MGGQLASGPAWVVVLHYPDNRVHRGGVVQVCKLCRVVAFDVEDGRGIDGFQDREAAALSLFQHSVLHGGVQGFLFLVGQLPEVGNVAFCQGALNDWVMLLTACHHSSYFARWVATCRCWVLASGRKWGLRRPDMWPRRLSAWRVLAR